jgi:ABC-type transporter Mla MlaB component
MAALANPEVIALGPELTIACADSHRQALLSALAAAKADGPAPALDLSTVTCCDTAGVQLLLAWRTSLAERGWALQPTSASAELREVLGLYGLADLLAGTAGEPR